MNQNHSHSKGVVAFYPSIAQMAGNPYWPMLAEALKQAGMTIYDDSPVSVTLKWIVRNRKTVNVLHLHYIQSLYCNGGKTRARLTYVILFAINLLLARMLGYRTVFTLHNLTPTTPLQPGWIDYLGHWVAANLSERVIVHCGEARRLLAARYGRTRHVHEVAHPNFIQQYPNTITKSEARTQLGLPQDAVVFTFFGGIRPNKGIELLIKAFMNIHNEKYCLLIAGNVKAGDAYGDQLRELVMDDRRITLQTRFIPDDEIQVILNVADMVVLPFAWILTSSTAILALSFTRPIIVPRMGCMAELVGTDRGWLFEPDDPESLAETMQVAAHSDFEQAGRNGYQFVSTNNLKRFGEQTLAVYLG